MKKFIAVVLAMVMTMSLLPLVEVCAAESVVTIVLDDSGAPSGASGTGWTYADGTLTLSKGYSFEVDGVCNVVVVNYGTIEGGTFNNKVSNTGSTKTLNEDGGVINDGIFNGDVDNYHGWNKCVVNGGTFNGKFTVGNHGVVNGGIFNGTYSEKLGYTIAGGTFKLIFETNGGEWKNGFVPPANYTYGNVTALPSAENIEKKNHNFLGWCTKSDLSGQVVSEISNTTHGIVTYYAKYEESVQTWVNVAQKAVAGTDYSIDDGGNYTVFTAVGLAYVANVVNGGDDLEGKIVVLDDDIDLMDAGLSNYTKDDVNTQTSWIPMKYFAGTLDGKGKKIKNLFVVTEDKDAGLIATNAGTIINLEIESGKIEQKLVLETAIGAGAIAAYNVGVIENCVNRANVAAESSISTMESVFMYVGGIVGSTGTSTVSPEYVVVRGCTNYGNITYSGSSSLEADCGGIVGFAYGGLIVEHGAVIENCKNCGNVSAEGSRLIRIGGIAGKSRSAATLGMYIKKCENTGDVCATAGTNAMAGGVVGYGYNTNTYVYNSFNTGDVTSNKTVGGVVGNSKSKVENCYSTGAVVTTVSGSPVGGVVGEKTGGVVQNCYYLAGDETSVGGINGNDVADSAEGKTLAKFKSGEVCYLLNADQSEIIFRQTIGEDDYPKFSGKAVTMVDGSYCNGKIVTMDGNDKVTNGTIVLGVDNGDGSYSLPENVVGYYINDDIVDAGKYDVSEGDIITTVKFNVEIVNGAQVRYGGGLDENGKVGKGNGLRFIAQVDRSEFDGESYGMKIQAEASSNFTDVVANKWQDDTTFSVAITDMLVSNYNRNYTATPFVKVKYDDGTEKTVYGTNTVTRSIYYVASGLMKTGGGNDDYTLAENARLYDVLNAYVNMVGVRMLLDSEGNITASDKYTGDVFFNVESVKNDDGSFSVTVEPLTENFEYPVKIKDYWTEFVRINNNNSVVKNCISEVNYTDNGVMFKFEAP